jgi:hypothetical protein
MSDGSSNKLRFVPPQGCLCLADLSFTHVHSFFSHNINKFVEVLEEQKSGRKFVKKVMFDTSMEVLQCDEIKTQGMTVSKE